MLCILLLVLLIYIIQSRELWIFILVILDCRNMWGASYPLFLQNISIRIYVTGGFQDKCLSLWYYFNL